ncbi:MAG: DUF305 domain-containing protein [Nocardioides sp.]|nr:DUF305 domain-containing protein [Nocardioides sp.]
MGKTLTALVAALTTMLVLTSCGGGEDSDGEPAAHTAADGQRFNDADVAFATDMVQHHAQALAMVDQTMGRDLGPRVERLAESIRAAQGPEIETMTGWLTDWDQPIPETVRDHANAHGGHAETDPDMPGMMSREQMAELEAAPDADFAQLFLTMMIDHHEGAVEMARAEQRDGLHPDAVALAEQIESAQNREIATMQRMLS